MADQDYIFISYKGEDPAALEIIRHLQRDGYRIWYDQRLTPSEQWVSEISRRIKGCGYFVTLLTDAFLRSEWCTKELTLAQKRKKPILAVHLAKNELPDGIDLLLADLFGVYRSACKSEEAFYHQIYKAKGLDAFRTQPEKEASPAPVSKPAPQTGSTASKAETINYPSGGSYTGETKNGQPHGFGTMSYSYSDYKKRDYYSGYWQNGQRHGQGKLVYRDGKVEEGVWSANTLLSPRKADAKSAPVKPKAPEAKPAPVTARELYDKVRIEDLYFRATGGGVTFGGGESLLHADFIAAFRPLCGNDWRINVETSLAVPRKAVEAAAVCVDTFIVDCKDMDPGVYRRYTGGDASLMTENLRWLLSAVGAERVHVRVPLIPEYNTPEHQARSAEALRKMGFTSIETFSYVIRENPAG